MSNVQAVFSLKQPDAIRYPDIKVFRPMLMPGHVLIEQELWPGEGAESIKIHQGALGQLIELLQTFVTETPPGDKLKEF